MGNPSGHVADSDVVTKRRMTTMSSFVVLVCVIAVSTTRPIFIPNHIANKCHDCHVLTNNNNITMKAMTTRKPAANHTAALPVVPTKPKSTSRKRQQSNADESATKHIKTVGNDGEDDVDDAAIAVEEENDAEKGGKKGKKGRKTGERKKTGAKGKNTSLTTCSRKTWADRQHEDTIENAKGTPAHLQPIERKLLAAGTSVAPPERPAHSHVGSVLPPGPTVSSSRTRVDREPELTAAKIDTTSDNDASNNSRSQAVSGDYSDSDSDNDTGGQSAKIMSATVRIGPPSRAKRTQPSEPITATVDASDDSILDVKMHSPPHGQSSQRGRARIVKAIGGSSGSQLVRSSGASKPYGATIRGRALGNAPNIGDFDAAGDDTSIDIEGTVNLFPSDTRPTTVDIYETAVIAVTIPFEGALAPLLQHVAKYYSPMSDNNDRVYILDQQKCKWIVKGRFRDALAFQDSVVHLWQKTEFGPTLTIFLESDPEVASAIPPSFLSHRSSSLSKSHSRSSRSPSLPAAVRQSLLISGQSSGRVASEAKSGLTILLNMVLNTGFLSSLTWFPVFIAKSQFYSSWKALFSCAQNYPQMKAWLDASSDAESESEVWAETKDPDHYTIVDLAEWLKRKDVVKGKRSAATSSGAGKKSGVKQEKRKKERKESLEESDESSGGKKLKLKSKLCLVFPCGSFLVDSLWSYDTLYVESTLDYNLAFDMVSDGIINISFSAFNQIIESTFGSNISLATVLTLLCTITENVDLLNLYFRQQHPEFQGENKTQTTGWMIALARALIDQLGSTAIFLYNDEDEDDSTPHDKVKLVAGKLNDMAVKLNLTPYDDQDAYMGKLLPVSQKAIQPVHMICPGSLVCGTATYHERFFHEFGGAKQPKRVYLNSANFHGSASAYSQYWNVTYGTKSTNLSRAHIWQAFVQDSLCTIAAESKIDLELNDPLNITEVTTQAFDLLGEQGIIRAADQHACSECSQPYKKASDAVMNDPAAVVGVDENQAVPPLAEDNRVPPQPHPASPTSQDNSDDDMDVDKRNVTMVVLDGVVMGPTVNHLKHCAIDDCNMGPDALYSENVTKAWGSSTLESTKKRTKPTVP
ncbi:uncharacterized protein LACBIDRAFT_322487 [Laccaria bicolor S238N-H82]|uniref:Predicted protein n=1 Tax=Laccaria bicolor (strain S238N-H82 / ATCC MYA-4686) TaxID=486041 RepID=B0CWG7_LACBS|nr:uncharacterized protein LACBIDRAFT_322487 [Laccaria bicolor S238N-H82]EDR13066.1 predicted protein [Laccaria bicolor S238N-H82]|eukprot:XP_001875564.1 predicted protein [Laccaria bicolor S238N-H82]